LKIIIVSLSFLPNVGGLENIMAGLAEEFSKEHEVIVYTKTKELIIDNSFSYSIIREFNFFTLWSVVKKADFYLEANISLKTFLVGICFYRKWFVTHQTSYEKNLNGFFKNCLTFFSNNISCSNFVKYRTFGKSIVIHNFFNNDLFKFYPTIKLKSSIVFLGRLVSDKGADLLIQAINILIKKGSNFQLTIIGNGPEEEGLRNIVNDLRLQHHIFFKGVLKGQSLVAELNKHDIMVIPSRWKEPFGIVALEGLACGCKIVCPNEGGLKEAAGPCSFLYHHNDLKSLIDAIEQSNCSLFNVECEARVQEHLKQHNKKEITNKYLEYIKFSLS
jgi:glycogen(starch) synthase